MTQSIEYLMTSIAQAAKEASWALTKLTSAQKNKILEDISESLISETQNLIDANEKDLSLARANNIPEAMLARLELTPRYIESIAKEVQHVASLKDPIGALLDGGLLESGLRIERRVVPLGVVAVIYEARPNVTIDVASLCLKTSNAVILRGGKETQHTNKLLVEILQRVLIKHHLPSSCIQAITDPDREWVNQLLKQDKYIDMLIPRGGASLHQLCKEHSRIPVITGGIGVCHIYLDASYLNDTNYNHPDRGKVQMSGQLKKAIEIIQNAKVQRPSACNSLETLLIDSSIAETFIPHLYNELIRQGVTFHVCPQTQHLLNQIGIEEAIEAVKECHYSEESLSLRLNMKIVPSIDDAIAHIRKYGTAHSDAILTNDMNQADYFIDAIDSAAVYVNASTRFTDGAQFGLGAEVAVSTQKLHARGPMGLDALTSYKWIARGDGTIRS